MSIKRFVAANARDALAQVRRELGAEALVLSNRSLTGGRVEILAAAPEAVEALVEDARPARQSARDTSPRTLEDAAPKVESFREFLRRQGQSIEVAKPAAEDLTIRRPTGTALYQSVAASGIEEGDKPQRALPPALPPTLPTTARPASPAASDPASQAPAAAPAVFRSRPEKTLAPIASAAGASSATAAQSDAKLLAELQSMRSLLLEQMATMSAAATATDMQKRSPTQVRVMTRLLSAGFSPEVARQIAGHAPGNKAPAQADSWLQDVLALNIKCAAAADSIVESGGVFALVGPTGVGKTTTVAKLAARFAVKYGTSQLGLITLDAYRVGAHEQLRAYGRILGAPVHPAQDAVTLRELLTSMAGKRLVLIDTGGISQRDERLGEMLEMLSQAGSAQRPVQRVLLLNAASHAETLDAVAHAWCARESGGAILTKLDEAARIGGALDAVLRHKLVLLGATDGQRVPEDWLAAASARLAALALAPGRANFALDEGEGALVASTRGPIAALASTDAFN